MPLVQLQGQLKQVKLILSLPVVLKACHAHPLLWEKQKKDLQELINLEDTTIGWRFVNPKLDKMYGTEGMIFTAENIATDFNISREDQDKFALHSQEKAKKAQDEGLLAEEIVPVVIPQRKGDPIVADKDEHLRLSSTRKTGFIKVNYSADGTVTAGNSSGVNDGAAALIIASEEAVKKYNLKPKAKILGNEHCRCSA